MPHRSRQRVVVRDHTGKKPLHRLQPEGTSYDWCPSYGVFPFPDHASYMDDVATNPGLYNPVNHLVVDSFIGSYNAYQRHPTNPAITGTPLGVGLHFPILPFSNDVLDWPWLPAFSSAQLSDWSVEAFNKFNDQVPTTVSLPNFLYELREMKSMIPSIDRKSLTKTASNNFLAFEFGVKPFINDIKAILAISESVDKRISHLLKTQGKESRLSFDRKFDYEEPYSFFRNMQNPYFNNVDDPGLNGVKFKRLSGRGNFHIGGTLKQDLTGLTDSMAKMKALAASGGFTHPARVIWNAIPYSFVIDWFFHVGKLLDSLSIQPFGGEYTVSEVGYSIKFEATYQAIQWMSVGHTILGNPLLGTVRVKSYKRVAGFPMSSLFLTDAALSPKQLVLAIAMLEQKRR